MAISAIRFKMLDKQTDVATTDFQSANSSDILNSPNMDTKDLTADMRDFFENDLQVASVKPANTIDKLTRASKDAMGSIKDIGSFSSKDIDGLISGLLGGSPIAKQLFGKLGPKCQTKGLGSGGFGKPYDFNLNCGGGNRKGKKDGCTSADYGNVLNSLTGGAYNSTFTDLNKVLQNLISLSKFGYDMNMCGVFSALGMGANNNVLSRASGALLGHLGNTGNLLGVFDLAGSSGGLHTLIENPSGITGVFKNFKIPSEIREGNYSDFSDRLTGSMQMFDENWNSSGYDGMISTSFDNGYNAEVDEVFRAKQLGYSFDTDNMDAAPTDDHAFMTAAYSMNNNSSMMEFFG